MTVFLALKLLHILSAIVLVGGLFARQLVRGLAERAQDIHAFAAQTAAASRIEGVMVIPASTVTLVLGVILALVSGQPVFGFIQGASRNWLLASFVLFLGILLLVPTILVPRGRKFTSVLADAVARDQITDELRRAQHDPMVRFAHRAEEIGLVVIVFLMVVKPF